MVLNDAQGIIYYYEPDNVATQTNWHWRDGIAPTAEVGDYIEVTAHVWNLGDVTDNIFVRADANWPAAQPAEQEAITDPSQEMYGAWTFNMPAYDIIADIRAGHEEN